MLMATYAEAGVHLDAARLAKERLREVVGQARGPSVLADVGPFAGLFSLSGLAGMRDPVLVASTDGVGTKVKIAAGLGRYDTIGHDIVNHCVNDIGVHGARPLFFLDYLALHRTEPDLVATVVGGVAAACRAVGCALLGGETAEMPDLYGPGELDLAGFIVGVVERQRAVLGDAVSVGDRLIGLPSSGLHTNGYSLARRVLPPDSWHDYEPNLGRTIGEALLEPHRCYLETVQTLLDLGASAFAHITGGGFAENVARVLPAGLAAEIDLDTWQAPPLFRLIADRGAVTRDELYRVFNMGIGLVAIMPPGRVAEARQALAECIEIGRVVEREEGAPVRLAGRGYGAFNEERE
jgi:phosphoribosylformylglycinamidine cyclo-ligase